MTPEQLAIKNVGKQVCDMSAHSSHNKHQGLWTVSVIPSDIAMSSISAILQWLPSSLSIYNTLVDPESVLR